MQLRVVCRSYGGENDKGRPAYYDKVTCLRSLLAAAAPVRADIVYVNDGPIPVDRLGLMRASGQCVATPARGMRTSYLTAFREALSRDWADDDVVWFSEDDYLYRPEALTALAEVAVAAPDADYFALYAATERIPIDGDGAGPPNYPASWRDEPPRRAGGHQWVRVLSTTSSFGVRVKALREDLGIIRFCMWPHRTMLRDHDTLVLVQGLRPYPYRDIASAALGRGGGVGESRVRALLLSPVRLATNLRAHRRPGRRRIMLAVEPNLASHMETAWLAPGTDWGVVAAGVPAAPSPQPPVGGG